MCTSISHQTSIKAQQFDLQARLDLGRYELIAEARNVTNQHRESFNGYGTTDQSFFGRQFWLGVAFTL